MGGGREGGCCGVREKERSSCKLIHPICLSKFGRSPTPSPLYQSRPPLIQTPVHTRARAQSTVPPTHPHPSHTSTAVSRRPPSFFPRW